jgi:5-enolpyruvylshikimate-3-phosphate synthase
MWEQLGLELEVALYVRTLVDAEQPGATANTRTLVRQAMESLGLTVAGLARNRWVIATDGASSASAPAEELDVEDGGGSARDRLRLLASG